MVKFQLPSLKDNGASITVALTFLSNFIISSFLNWIVFGTFPTWGQFVGAILFSIGLYFIAFGNVFTKKKKKPEQIIIQREELQNIQIEHDDNENKDNLDLEQKPLLTNTVDN